MRAFFKTHMALVALKVLRQHDAHRPVMCPTNAQSASGLILACVSWIQSTPRYNRSASNTAFSVVFVLQNSFFFKQEDSAVIYSLTPFNPVY